jgi:small subunit ribosomal protein S13
MEKTIEREVEKPKEEQKIVRVGETNLDGTKTVGVAIRKIKGVSFSYANAVAKVSGFENKRLGELSEEELNLLEDIMVNPEKHSLPSWCFNRRKDPNSGTDKHLIMSQLDLTQKMDINEEKRIKSYVGIRHILGLPVRGQRTRSSFRKGKVVGVKRGERARAKK